jgi:small subunit ribosomal protein S8
MSKVMNCEKVGKKECLIKPSSTIIKKVLDVLNAENYVGKYDQIEDGKGGHLKLNLLGSVNKCGSVRPRFSVTMSTYEKFEKRYLPAKGFGSLIVSTSKGIMTHEQAKEKKIGGKLLAYCY